MKVWKGETPKRVMSIKLDGIQAQLTNGKVVSRSHKPLHNIDPEFLEVGKRYEVYVDDFKTTNSIVRTHNHERKIQKRDLFEIWPGTDPRLLMPLLIPVERSFQIAREFGFEGLVIDQEYKLKEKLTFDVPIVGIIPGKGKHAGRMGALMTSMGKVGTGFTDSDRERAWQIGELIEVECMELTTGGKFRHPRFVRVRWDKAEADA